MDPRTEFVMKLENNLRTGIEVLAELISCQKRMYQAVVARDWVAVQEESDLLRTFTENFQDYESRRKVLLSSYAASHPGLTANAVFYTVSCTFSGEDRDRLNALYRENRRLLVVSKSENDALNRYVVNAKHIVSGILETIVPARKNKIYTRKGAIAQTASECLVVNRSF